MSITAASTTRSGSYSEALVVDAARELRASMGTTAGVAFTFCSPDYMPYLEEFCEVLRVEGHIQNVVGATGTGHIHRASESESVSGFSVLTLTAPSDFPCIVPESPKSAGVRADAWITLANPYALNIETWIDEWTALNGRAPIIGGLASGGSTEHDCAVFLNGIPAPTVCVGILPPTHIIPVVSAACRPIGEPLTVTRAEDNVVYSLGSHPAYEALESAFDTLTDLEKESAKGNLFAGLAGTEYVEDFRPTDFLVRNILAADPSSGAVVIGGIPRVGQTLQYQLRDAGSATSDLQATLKATVAKWGAPAASLVFACLGRGSSLFGTGTNDAATIQSVLGPHPSTGLFCNGEIGPIGTKNCVHTYSLACALFTTRCE